ncbi:collectrin isoform X2 [Dasypus novemcinctus]|uniref:collectrin isoform X2 n=1 Tax=Dasypus novemcinctus TaxID=9361 RepID=UPI00265E0CA4|nr:collectrin isoform X2 [Dasypus novemcinctus]
MAKAALSGECIFPPGLPCVFHSERMLWPFFFLVAAIHAELCQPDGENAFKVRLSIRTALGDKAAQLLWSLQKVSCKLSDEWLNCPWGSSIKAKFSPLLCLFLCIYFRYAWDSNEEYLFKAMVAFSMRKVPNRETTEISHVLLCNVTQRVSFWFVVTDPLKNYTLPAVEVESAIRMNRNRINNAFFLNDQTLEFLKIPSTLAPPTDSSVPIWIIIFGVIFCIVIVAVMLLVLSGIRQRRRKNKEPSEVDEAEDKGEATITIENGIPCDPLDTKGGHINEAFMTEEERLTPL